MVRLGRNCCVKKVMENISKMENIAGTWNQIDIILLRYILRAYFQWNTQCLTHTWKGKCLANEPVWHEQSQGGRVKGQCSPCLWRGSYRYVFYLQTKKPSRSRHVCREVDWHICIITPHLHPGLVVLFAQTASTWDLSTQGDCEPMYKSRKMETSRGWWTVSAGGAVITCSCSA